MEINAKTGSEAYLKVIALLTAKGETVQPRGLPTRELRHVTIRVDDPRQVHVLSTHRRPNLGIAAVEGYQLLGGVSNLAQLDQVSNGNFSRFADDGILRGAYGPRAFFQLRRVVELLRRDPATRQAVVTLWRGDETEIPSRDVPCTTTMQFFRRDRQLEMRVTMRSNDAWLGIPYDWMMFSLLHRAVARSLNVTPGAYVHCVGSLHLYQRDANSAQRVLEGGYGPWVGAPPAVTSEGLPLPHHGRTWDEITLFAETLALRESNAVLDSLGHHEWYDWLSQRIPPRTGQFCPLCRYVYPAETDHHCGVVPTRVGDTYRDLHLEYGRARRKHGAYTLDGDEVTDIQRLAALMEEVGEAAQELTYDHGDAEQEIRLRTELIQVANVATTWASMLARKRNT